MRKTILICFLLLLSGCIKKIVKPDRSADPSPILIADGSSIDSRQLNGWTGVSAKKLSVSFPGYHSANYAVKACPMDSDGGGEDSNGAGNHCVNPADRIALPAENWKFDLCSTNACDDDHANVIVSQGAPPEVDVESRTNHAFGPRTQAHDGDSRKLDQVHFNWWRLTINGTPGAATQCVPGHNQKCVLRIHYCKLNCG